MDDLVTAELPPVLTHFGERVRVGRYGYRLTRELYAQPNSTPSAPLRRDMVSPKMWEQLGRIYEDDAHTRYTEAWVTDQRAGALENFDRNMAFFSRLDQAAFDDSMTELLARQRGLREIDDLRPFDGVAGLYVMILGAYRQAYVGQSSDIRKRIRAHWNGTKSFDRLLWGSPQTSILSIDSFRPLDTTRILVARTSNGFALEEKIVRALPPDFLLNRVPGGELTGLRALWAVADLKRRSLT